MNDNNTAIFGTFRPLSQSEIRGNAIEVSLYAATLPVVIGGIALAVKFGRPWIGAIAGFIWLFLVIFVTKSRSQRYVSRFGSKYNVLRLLIGGFLVYTGVAWRGLLGFYNHLEPGVSLSVFGRWISVISLLVTLISNVALYRISDEQVADLIGVMEITALAIFIGSMMFLLLYT